MFTERAELYSEDRLMAVELASRTGKFAHSFGGPVRHQGATENDCGIPLHLLYAFDMTDPLVPIKLPGIRWLPLYYCFQFNRLNRLMETRYRVLSDDRVEMFIDSAERDSPEIPRFPAPEFPAAFPQLPVRIRKTRFNPAKLAHVEWYYDVFGTRHLSEEDRRRLVARCREDHPASRGEWTGSDDQLIREYRYGPSCQGHPMTVCPNPACTNHTRVGSLRIFAIVPAFPFGDFDDCDDLDSILSSVCIWGPPLSDHQFAEIIFETCPLCSAIVATNQCT